MSESRDRWLSCTPRGVSSHQRETRSIECTTAHTYSAGVIFIDVAPLGLSLSVVRIQRLFCSMSLVYSPQVCSSS